MLNCFYLIKFVLLCLCECVQCLLISNSKNTKNFLTFLERNKLGINFVQLNKTDLNPKYLIAILLNDKNLIINFCCLKILY